MGDVVVSSIDLPPKFGRGGNFLRESKNLLGFWAEVVAVKILVKKTEISRELYLGTL